MSRYRITCLEGDQYDIIATSMDVTENWVKFFDYDLARDQIFIIAAIRATNINNIQIVNNHTGEAERIMAL